jgi:D-glycero-D-manno-heptose 1,7-bisphosphate phosphatase
MTIKTIFLDRDGVVNKEINYLHKIEDCSFINGVFEACQYFKSLGYQIIIVTNQSGISRGYFSEKDFQIITNWMINQFECNDINILDIFHCPHSPKSNCDCRKPKPGMFISAKNKHNIDMEKSWMIGDSERDITAANLAGIKNTILVRSGYKVNESKSNAMFFLDSIYQANQIIIK